MSKYAHISVKKSILSQTSQPGDFHLREVSRTCTRAQRACMCVHVLCARASARTEKNVFFWLFFNGFFAVYIPVLPSFPTKYDVGSDCPAAVPHKPHRRLISPVITLIILCSNNRH